MLANFSLTSPACSPSCPVGTGTLGGEPSTATTQLTALSLCLSPSAPHVWRQKATQAAFSPRAFQLWGGAAAVLVLGPHHTCPCFPEMHRYTAKEWGNISVRCTYSTPDYRAATKTWCKESAGNRCNELVNTDWKPLGYLRPPQQGRVTIQDDAYSGVVTITMEELQVQDSGVYWCALYEYTDLFRMVEVTLSISEGKY